MKTRIFTALAAVGLMAAKLIAPASAQQEKSFSEMASSEAKYTPVDFSFKLGQDLS